MKKNDFEFKLIFNSKYVKNIEKNFLKIIESVFDKEYKDGDELDVKIEFSYAKGEYILNVLKIRQTKKGMKENV